jgi:molybdopterin converting factor subunit 1
VSEFSLQIRLFAILREHAGAQRLELVVPSGTTVKRLLALIRVASPGLGPFLAATRVAVNMTFAQDDQEIFAGDDVALIPPVGGG